MLKSKIATPPPIVSSKNFFDNLITVDGQVGTTLGLDETLRVHRAARPILIIRFPGSSFFATLRKKLGWGGLPERDELPS